MTVTLLPTHDREALLTWYAANRRRSRQLFDLVAPEAYTAQPIPLRHPIVFYEGHLPAFSFITLVRGSLAGKALDDSLERLFQRGIDPADARTAQRAQPASWPPRERIREAAQRWDEAVLEALRNEPLERITPAAYTLLEHEQMHHETLLFMLHRLPTGELRKPQGYEPRMDGARPVRHRVKIPAGRVTLGAARDELDFGWDNEFEACREKVAEFSIDAHSVTNDDYLAFVEHGGEPPPFWVRRGHHWALRALFEVIPLPLAWPVYVSRDQAVAYAAWKGARLPTEAEFHRAAYGTP
ncbi:MAG: SUMF1/EgtB/PvdO family nonheme iron enzyme, partial [bacterium]|nr:SUMF1/EgtB/PvdO family nonheme iron enzyme [bacterium]